MRNSVDKTTNLQHTYKYMQLKRYEVSYKTNKTD